MNSEETTKSQVWTTKIEKNIKSLWENAVNYRKIHNNISRKYSNYNNKLMYISICLGPLVGLLTEISIKIEDTTVLPLIVIFISFLSGIVCIIIKFSNWNDKAYEHKSTASRFAALANNMKRQLAIDRDYRENVTEYMTWLGGCYDKLYENSPIISESDKLFYDNINIDKESLSFDKNSEEDVSINIVEEEGNSGSNFSDGQMKYELQRFSAT